MLKQLAAAAAAAALALGAAAVVRGLTPDARRLAAGATPIVAAPAADPLKIMPLGDSITYGLGSQTRSSYRIDLQKRLARAGLAVDFVGSRSSGSGADPDNEGHGGRTIRQIAAQATDWLGTHQPDAVLLHLGTNDMAFGDDVSRAPARLSALIDQIHAARPSAQVFVQKIVGSRKPWLQRRINAYNAALPAVVAAKDSRVHLVDQSNIREVDLYDMVHPNEFGYAKMSFNLYNALDRVYGAASAPWPAAESPYRFVKAYLCHWAALTPGGGSTGSDCRWWYRRGITVAGRTSATAKAWQTQRMVAVKYGKKKRKVRFVTRWSNS